jgi:hypothetical protein
MIKNEVVPLSFMPIKPALCSLLNYMKVIIFQCSDPPYDGTNQPVLPSL